MREKNSKKILVIRLSSLGDVLLTYPLLDLIKKNESNCTLHFVVKDKFVDAIQFNHNVDKTFTYSPENIKQINSLVQENNYDLILDLQNNFRSRQITSKSKAKIYRFKKPTLKKFLLVNFRLKLIESDFSIARSYIKNLYPDYSDKLTLYFDIPQEKEIDSLKKIPPNFLNKPIIGIAPGSKHFTKRYPIDYLKVLINMLIENGFAVGIFGGKDDYEICKSLETNNEFLKNFQNDNDLLEIASLMKKCSVIISNDSGLMHLASLLQIPIVAIFGTTVREFGFAPIFEKSLIIENTDLKCRPCSHIGRDSCPKKHFKCMLDIQPELIFQKTIELLESVQV